jgi:4-hydroxy-tetrahydrodipicolinate reductase
MLKLAVLGAGGRMGRAILAEAARMPDIEVSGAVEQPGHPACGTRLPEGVEVTADAGPVARAADVLIDFTTPDGLDAHLRAALDGRAALVVGTTGLGPRHHAAIDAAAQTIPILQAANMSLGVTVLEALVEQAARVLGPEWDIDIIEWHHRHKIDAPSGTALALGEAAARGRGATLGALRLPPHDGLDGARKPGGIGFASVRVGTVAGEHQVILAAEGERLVLGHSAEHREVFARGAVAAARWLDGRDPGRYRMAQVLGL